MKKFTDQQPSLHETSAKSPLEKVTAAIAKDNEHHREVMLSLCDANTSKHEKDTYNQALPKIKTDQQKALAKFVQTGDKKRGTSRRSPTLSRGASKLRGYSCRNS